MVMTDRYSKLTRIVPVSKTPAYHAELTFIESCIMPYSIPDFLFTDSRLQFVVKFLDAFCGFVGNNWLQQGITGYWRIRLRNTTKDSSHDCLTSSTNTNRIGMCAFNCSHMCRTDNYTNPLRWIHLFYPWRVNSQSEPYRTLQRPSCTMPRNKYRRNSSAYTCYFDNRSCEQNRTRLPNAMQASYKKNFDRAVRNLSMFRSCNYIL